VKEGRPVLPLFVAKYEINPAVEILAHLLALYTQAKQILNKNNYQPSLLKNTKVQVQVRNILM
jgi:hypothetical protein